MQIKVNKEIRKYKETIFFGLTMRQFLCSLLAIGLAVGVYYLLGDKVNRDALGWLCILAAAPIAVAGFFEYHGMKLEKFIRAWIKSAILSRPRIWRGENYCNIMIKEAKKLERIPSEK